MYPGLNGIRAFAFLAVFLLHVHRMGGGYMGVMAFFVLSGFLLTPILVQMRASLTTADFFVRFYGRRTLRIFPLYYAYLGGAGAVACLALYWGGDFRGDVGVRAFLAQWPWAAIFMMDFVHAGANYTETPLISHFWSLAVEEQFYLLWPLAIFLTPPEKLRSLLLGLTVAGPFIRWAIASDLFASWFPQLNPVPNLRVYFLPFSHLDAFAIGGYFALYGRSRGARYVWLLGAVACGAGYVSTWLAIRQFNPLDFGYAAGMRDAYQYIWGYTLVNLFFACLTLHVRDRKFLPQIFEHPVLDYLGRISYGLYVYHFGIIFVVKNALYEWPEFVRVPLSLGLTIAVSALSYALLEKRFISLKDRYFEKRSERETPEGDPDAVRVPASG